MPCRGLLHHESVDTWKFALLGGALTIPATVASYWETGSKLSLSAVLLGGLIAAYLAERRTGTSEGVGVRAGLVGALPVLLVVADIVAASTALSGPAGFMAAGTVLTALVVVVFATFGFGVSAMVGALGGKVGAWLAGAGRRDNPPTVGS